MISKIPNCLNEQEYFDVMMFLADRVAANCSASNGQVLDAMCELFNVVTEESPADEALLVRVADRMAALAHDREMVRNENALGGTTDE